MAKKPNWRKLNRKAELEVTPKKKRQKKAPPPPPVTGTFYEKKSLAEMGMKALRSVAKDFMARLKALGKDKEINAASKEELRSEISSAQTTLKRNNG